MLNKVYDKKEINSEKFELRLHLLKYGPIGNIIWLPIKEYSDDLGFNSKSGFYLC